MKRRTFLKDMLALAVAPHFLPGAGRIWKATMVVPSFKFDPVSYMGEWQINRFCVNATREMHFIFNRDAYVHLVDK